MGSDIRWQQRFQNFEKAYHLLREPFEGDASALSDLEKQGVIQRFEMAAGLSWETLKDYLKFQGFVVLDTNPKGTLEDAVAAGIISDAQRWLEMFEFQLTLLHEPVVFSPQDCLEEIESRYLALISELFEGLACRAV